MSIPLPIPSNSAYASILEYLVAEKKELLAEATAARAAGVLLDLTAPLPQTGSLELLTFEDEAGRETFRHTASHVLAQAVLRLFPEAKPAIGPAIADGFYYDFDVRPFTPEDLVKIEAEMKKIVAEKLPLRREEISRAEAIKRFEARGDKYKVELLQEISAETVTLYHQGDFFDLCRGPHLTSTGRIKAFKLMEVAGAYWRGDEHNQMLQRIYGTAFPTKEALAEYLARLEEAKKRDHRVLGRALDLFSTNDLVGPGLILWHPKGAVIRETIENFWRKEHRRRGYQIVFTPHIGRANLWQTSGHLGFYKDSMYAPMEIEGDPYYIKPMNCPFHIFIYKSALRSYRELPMRYCELGTVYRYERSGTLYGMQRVRGFTQDDAHIICTPEQMQEEVGKAVKFVLFMIRTFGYHDIDIRLSVRSVDGKKEYLGTDEQWQQAEASLESVLKESNLPYKRDEGEAVFYGPKIDMKLRDAIGNEWQGPTIQFDFNLPERFGMEYVDAEGNRRQPIMIHRALLGSLERFVAGLVEHYAGVFPTWLAPVQVRIIPIADRHNEYAQGLLTQLLENDVRAEIDDRRETMGNKIRQAQNEKIPYMLVIGDREMEAGAVAVRHRADGDLGAQPFGDFLAKLLTETVPPKINK
jgi:threonyl-tRNA synthetase